MKIRAIAALLFILISVSAFGEGRIKITGYVRDADGNPLELVNVRVKNTLIGSMTNEKGYYSFSISPGDSISIIYSCLGYNKAERIIPSAQADMRLNVQMNYTSFDLRGSICYCHPQADHDHGVPKCGQNQVIARSFRR